MARLALSASALDAWARSIVGTTTRGFSGAAAAASSRLFFEPLRGSFAGSFFAVAAPAWNRISGAPRRRRDVVSVTHRLISAQVDVILSEDTVCGYTCCTTIELDSVTYKRVDTTAAATCCDNKCTYWDESSTS